MDHSVAFDTNSDLSSTTFAQLTPFQRAFVFGARGPTCAQAAAQVQSRLRRGDEDAHDFRIECALMQFHIDQLFADLQRRFVHALGSGARRVALHSIRSPLDDAALKNVAKTLFRIWFRRLDSDELAVLRGGAPARRRVQPLCIDLAISALFWIALIAMCLSPRFLAEFLLQRSAERIVQALQIAGALAALFVNFHVSDVLVKVAMALFIGIFVLELVLARPLVFLVAAAARLGVLFAAAALFWTASNRSGARLLHLYRFAKRIAPREAEFVTRRNARVTTADEHTKKPTMSKPIAVKSPVVNVSSAPATKRRKSRKSAASPSTIAAVHDVDDEEDDDGDDDGDNNVITTMISTAPRDAMLSDLLAPPSEADLFAFADLTAGDEALLRDTLDFSSLYKDESHTLALFGDQLPAFDDPQQHD